LSETLEANMTRIYLNVPFEEKHQAKLSGARWDAFERRWYVEGRTLTPFMRWITPGDPAIMRMSKADVSKAESVNSNSSRMAGVVPRAQEGLLWRERLSQQAHSASSPPSPATPRKAPARAAQKPSRTAGKDLTAPHQSRKCQDRAGRIEVTPKPSEKPLPKALQKASPKPRATVASAGVVIENLPYPPWLSEQEAIDAGLIEGTPSPMLAYERELLAHA
jgi:Domain of unknown function (DUF5710)